MQPALSVSIAAGSTPNAVHLLLRLAFLACPRLVTLPHSRVCVRCALSRYRSSRLVSSRSVSCRLVVKPQLLLELSAYSQ